MSRLFSLVQLATQSVEAFPADRFTSIRDVPVFTEHERTVSDGRRLTFGPAELTAVATRCNERIERSGDYAAITIGHTREPGDDGPEPELVGFAGPFRVGDFRGKQTIFADLHVFREDAQRLSKFPRRSPELWLEDQYEDMYLDPIALLGAEAPYLDLGLLYTARRGNRQAVKYTAVAPAAGNVFVPSHHCQDKNKEQYTMPLATEDVQQIVAAIEQTDWVQWVKSKMSEDAGDAAAEDYQDDEQDKDVETDRESEKYQDGDDKSTPPAKELDAMPTVESAAPDKERDAKRHHASAERYAKLQQDVQRYRQDLDRVTKALDTERAHRVDAERYARLYERRQQYAFDLDKAVDRCKYGKMTDAQFDDHLAMIDENFRPIPVDESLPTHTPGTRAAATGNREKYDRTLSDRALKICETKAAAGQKVNYGKVLEDLKAGKNPE